MTNADLEKLVDTSDEWIVSRTGIKQRHIAEDSMSNADMAAEAAKGAMESAGVSHEEIDLVISATVTPDYRLPSNACVLQEMLGFPNAVAFDVVAACTGFINGLTIADSFIRTGRARKAVIVGSEKLSAITDWSDRNTCVLFADGAGAVVVEACDTGSGVLSTFLRSDGKMRPLLWTKVGGTRYPYTDDYPFDKSDKIRMNGADLFKVAVKEMANAARQVIEDANLTPDDVTLFVPHQANIRIIEGVAKRLKIDRDRVFVNIEEYGNTSAASVPIALHEASQQGLLKPGDNVVMVAFGGGLIWGAAAVKW